MKHLFTHEFYQITFYTSLHQHYSIDEMCNILYQVKDIMGVYSIHYLSSELRGLL